MGLRPTGVLHRALSAPMRRHSEGRLGAVRKIFRTSESTLAGPGPSGYGWTTHTRWGYRSPVHMPIDELEITAERRAVLHRRVRFIVAATITYNLIEAVVAMTAAVTSSSAALLGFALDSVIEVSSAAAIAWQFTRKSPERWEKATIKVVVIAFFALAAWVTVEALMSLFGGNVAEHSTLGLIITGLSLALMPALAWLEIRTGRELRSKSVIADAHQLLLCMYLSATVFIGISLNSLFGWWWADSVAALVVAVLAVREGLEAWGGEVASPFEVLESLDDKS